MPDLFPRQRIFDWENEYHPANNGANKMRWFAVRGHITTPRTYLKDSRGRLRRFASYEAAAKAAEQANNA